jgi:hypothetical protein
VEELEGGGDALDRLAPLVIHLLRTRAITPEQESRPQPLAAEETVASSSSTSVDRRGSISLASWRRSLRKLLRIRSVALSIKPLRKKASYR